MAKKSASTPVYFTNSTDSIFAYTPSDYKDWETQKTAIVRAGYKIVTKSQIDKSKNKRLKKSFKNYLEALKKKYQKNNIEPKIVKESDIVTSTEYANEEE